MTTKTIDIIQDATAVDMTTTGNTEVDIDTETGLVPTDTTTWLAPPEIDPADLYIPRLKLGQATTNEVTQGDAKPGQWIVQGYPGIQNPTIVPLTYKKIYRRVSTNSGKPVACYNHTDKDPNADCPNCRWQFDPNLASYPDFTSVLTPTHLFHVYIAETGGPAAVEFLGTSETAGKILLSKIVYKGLGKFAVKLGSVLTKNNKGQWYVAAIQELPEQPADLLAEVQTFIHG